MFEGKTVISSDWKKIFVTFSKCNGQARSCNRALDIELWCWLSLHSFQRDLRGSNAWGTLLFWIWWLRKGSRGQRRDEWCWWEVAGLWLDWPRLWPIRHFGAFADIKICQSSNHCKNRWPSECILWDLMPRTLLNYDDSLHLEVLTTKLKVLVISLNLSFTTITIILSDLEYLRCSRLGTCFWSLRMLEKLVWGLQSTSFWRTMPVLSSWLPKPLWLMFSMQWNLRKGKRPRRRGSFGRLLQITPTHVDSNITPKITTQNDMGHLTFKNWNFYITWVSCGHLFLN